MIPLSRGPERGGLAATLPKRPAVLLAAAVLVALATVLAASAGEAGARWEAGSGRATFVLHTFWHDVEGSTTRVTGNLVSAGGDPLSDGVVSVSVEAATLDTANAKRDRNMREEFLETAKYPTLVFHSTAPPVKKGGSVTVDGDLTIHGVTRKVHVDVEAKPVEGEWTMKTAFNVRLSDHKIPDPSVALNKVYDEVNVGLEIRFRKAE